MSKRLDVIKGVKALVALALPGAEVRGLDNDAVFPTIVPANGLAVVRDGDPGEPDVDLSPLLYNYQHRIPVEIATYQSAGRTGSEALDDMLGPIGAAIAADRTIGGLCDWLEAEAPAPDDLAQPNAKPAKTVILMIVAHYATPDPLN